MKLKPRRLLPALCAILALALLFSACTSPMDMLKKTFSDKETETETGAEETTSAEDLVDHDAADPFKGLVLSEYITLGNYKGVTAEYKTTAGTADVTRRAEELFQQNNVPMGIKDEAAKTKAAKGDLVEFDYEGTAEGATEEDLAGMKGSITLTIGSGQFIEGFEDQLIGHGRDQEFDVNVTFPDPYQSETLAGKPAVFKCVIHKIGVAALTDESVQTLTQGEMTTVKELLDYVREELENHTYPADNLQAVLDAALKGAKRTDKALPDNEANYYVKQAERQAENYGVSMEEYLASYEGGLEAFRKNENDKQVLRDLFAFAVAEKEGLKVTDDELQAFVEDLRTRDGDDASDEAIFARYGRGAMLRYLMGEKVKKLIYDNAAGAPPYKDPNAQHEH